jgi:peptidoglycan/LPS O-acetylase OafA/YrhL
LSQSLRPIWLFNNPVTSYLGKISFSLYLVHPFIIYAVPVTPVISKLPIDVNIKLALYCVFALLAATLAASALYRWIEVPGQELGRKLLRR